MQTDYVKLTACKGSASRPLFESSGLTSSLLACQDIHLPRPAVTSELDRLRPSMQVLRKKAASGGQVHELKLCRPDTDLPYPWESQPGPQQQVAQSSRLALFVSGSFTKAAGPECALLGSVRDPWNLEQRCRAHSSLLSIVDQTVLLRFSDLASMPAKAKHPVAGEFLNGGFYGGRAAALEVALR